MDDQFRLINVRTWHLHFEGMVPSVSKSYELEIWKNPSTDEYLSLYKLVGRSWGWCGRLLLTTVELAEKLNSPDNEVWLFKKEDVLLGFFEIDRSHQGEAEIVYVGLLPEVIGKGHGKPFLEAAIATASGPDNKRVWLHTCEYDHPKALEIYRKAGFVIDKATVEKEYYSTDFLEEIRKSR
jgi:GNAT superfamily N-acetyltransferase